MYGRMYTIHEDPHWAPPLVPNGAISLADPGGSLLLASWKPCNATPICFRLLMHCVREAASRTFCTAGTNRAIRMAIMAMTTSNSINVNAVRFRESDATMAYLKRKKCDEVWGF